MTVKSTKKSQIVIDEAEFKLLIKNSCSRRGRSAWRFSALWRSTSGAPRRMSSMGVLDRDGDGVFDFDETNAAFQRDDFHNICMHHHRRYASCIAAVEQLAESQRLRAAEIGELARWVRMPTKLVRDSTGRSVGAKKVPGLGKLH